MERIAKFIARCGITSRRKAEDLIRNGQVSVNGTIVQELGMRIDPSHDVVTVDSKRLTVPPLKYFLFYKPRGVIATKDDTHARKTVLDFFPPCHRDIHPVGRLDKDTTGVLLLTNDGSLTNRLIHPRYGITKTYEVIINGCITAHRLQQIQKGIRVDEGMTQPAEVIRCKRKARSSCITIKIKEGKKRQIKRMFAAVGYTVKSLRRTAFGSLTTGTLTEGAYRSLTGREVKRLWELANETH